MLMIPPILATEIKQHEVANVSLYPALREIHSLLFKNGGLLFDTKRVMVKCGSHAFTELICQACEAKLDILSVRSGERMIEFKMVEDNNLGLNEWAVYNGGVLIRKGYINEYAGRAE